MRCKFCQEYRKKVEAILDQKTSDWEWWDANEGQLWDTESQLEYDYRQEAISLLKGDARKAIEQLKETAIAGSPIISRKVGWHIETGTDTAKDYHTAKTYYLASWQAGSVLAALDYARCCFHLKEFGEDRRVLEQLISCGFQSAHYHLANHLYFADDKREYSPEVLHHINLAAAEGHPQAKFWHAKLMFQGRLGLSNILKGAKILVSQYREFSKQM